MTLPLNVFTFIWVGLYTHIDKLLLKSIWNKYWNTFSKECIMYNQYTGNTVCKSYKSLHNKYNIIIMY